MTTPYIPPCPDRGPSAGRPGPGEPPPSLRRELAGLRQNLRNGLRLAVLLTPPRRAAHVSAWQLIGLLGLLAGAAFGVDLLLVPEPRYFYPESLAVLGAQALLLALLLYAALRWLGAGSGLERALTLGAAAALLPLLAAKAYLALAVRTDTEPGTAAQVIWLCWVALILLRTCDVAVPTRGLRRSALALSLAAGALAVLELFASWPALIHYDDSPALEAEAEAPAPMVDVEATYYAQAARLEDALDALAPQRRGVVDLYFVGFAAYAEQAVFMREVQHFQSFLDRRFDTAGRSLLLVNHPEVVERLPLANRYNLAHALARIGALIDPEEDVVFVYLTSHGSEDGRLAVSFPGLGPSDLTAPALAEMLAKSGIRWQVVAISACYSGSFLDALAGPTALVMTAARADRTSFGCSNDREFTYFGEALRGALSERPSFPEAFDLARERVVEREQAEGKEPSLPQMRIGEQIAVKLREVRMH